MVSVSCSARLVRLKERVIFVRGVAHNRCICQLLSDKLSVEITVPKEPQIAGTLGAALLTETKGKA